MSFGESWSPASTFSDLHTSPKFLRVPGGSPMFDESPVRPHFQYCTQCKLIFEEGDGTCPQCGAPLGEEGQSAAPIESPWDIVFAILFILACIACLIAAGMALSRGSLAIWDILNSSDISPKTSPILVQCFKTLVTTGLWFGAACWCSFPARSFLLLAFFYFNWDMRTLYPGAKQDQTSTEEDPVEGHQ